ncbi:hypothetical protein NITMOv2_2211 [Nitrospira moscoviensis]|uniref:Uncharacterized protein n=1 Tax=Nitrospira moscoviensis TaxID=42253 RepID=A0A0K2GDD3_NITMO|nr:hypothetical protein NITMOv2_2211 [Nitrospira moscoviensis]
MRHPTRTSFRPGGNPQDNLSPSLQVVTRLPPRFLNGGKHFNRCSAGTTLAASPFHTRRTRRRP